jgi:hypothetical protein
MCSVGLSLIFGTTGLTNFAYGEMVTFGGMTAFLLNVTGIGFLAFLGFLPLIDDDGGSSCSSRCRSRSSSAGGSDGCTTR